MCISLAKIEFILLKDNSRLLLSASLTLKEVAPMLNEFCLIFTRREEGCSIQNTVSLTTTNVHLVHGPLLASVCCIPL